MCPSVSPESWVGKFKVVEILSRTKYATVFMTQMNKGKEIVVKAIDFVTRDEELQKEIIELNRKLRSILALENPYVVRHFSTEFDMNASSPFYYIFMEFCRGGTLEQCARKEEISGALLQKWTRQILSGIAYIHANRIVHRDIKGANILLSTKDRNICVPKIADFGEIERLLCTITGYREVSGGHGTCTHMSPEMIKNSMDPSDFNIGRKSDIWSFGCVLIEMLNGGRLKFIKMNQEGEIVHRFQGSHYNDPLIYYIGTGGRPEILSDWPRTAKDMIERCLLDDPQDRPSAADLLEDRVLIGEFSAWNRSNSIAEAI